VDKQTVIREGSGKKGSPYTYWLPLTDSQPENSFSPNPHPLDGGITPRRRTISAYATATSSIVACS
jgi:hypothetical protein